MTVPANGCRSWISGDITRRPIVAPVRRELHQILRLIDGTGSSLFCFVGIVTETAAVTAGVETLRGVNTGAGEAP
jgi:hypothetical protein